MDIILAKSAGFCYGVRRALDTILKSSKSSDGSMYTLGPLIHNPQVIEKLESEGIKSVKSLNDIPAGSTVIMPSHGVPKNVMEEAISSGFTIVDVTCPFVGKVHKVAEKLVRQGYQVIVLGDKGHTEVRGILSVAGDDAIAVSGVEELHESMLKNRVGIISQTTQTEEQYRQLVSWVAEHAYEVHAFNTICNATTERQKAALQVADKVDVMVVVGGRNSANTRRLAEICTQTGTPTHHVEIASELDERWFKGIIRAGVTAGASTPDWIIEEVAIALREMKP